MAVALVAVVLVPDWASAQTYRDSVVQLAEAAGTGVEAQARDGGTWTLPRRPDGHPDLEGIWTNDTITPFERPARHADKPFLTAEEVADLEAVTAAERAEEERLAENFRGYNRFWLDSGTTVLSSGQTSLVVNPSDGKVPVRPDAEARRNYNLAHVADSYAHMSVWDRCISRGVPGSMFPAGYNNAYRILQTPGYVVIFHEMIHDARVIPLDGRPHVGTGVRQWMGDSRGHWESDTLVVETTNYHDRGWIASSGAGGRIKGIPVSEALHVVERFTRVSADIIEWHVTIEDPNVYLRPWTVFMPLTLDPNYVMFEYACHEGNHAVENILRGGRVEDRAAAASSR